MNPQASRKKIHGTAPSQMSFNQFGQILNAFTLALPQALRGHDPKQVINVLGVDGEGLTKDLKEMLRRMVWMKYPGYDYKQTKEHGYQLYHESWEPLESLGKFHLAIILRRGEGKISGKDAILNRAKIMGASLGQLHAEELLRNKSLRKQFSFDREWKLIFPGTVWKHKLGFDDKGAFYVPCLRGGMDGFGMTNLDNEFDNKTCWLVPDRMD